MGSGGGGGRGGKWGLSTPVHPLIIGLKYVIWAVIRDNLLLHANNKVADQPVHPCSLITLSEKNIAPCKISVF